MLVMVHVVMASHLSFYSNVLFRTLETKQSNQFLAKLFSSQAVEEKIYSVIHDQNVSCDTEKVLALGSHHTLVPEDNIAW